MGAPLGNKNALENNGGRPSQYKPECAEIARKLCMLKLGVTDKDLAEFFEVDIRTIYQWKKDHIEFSQAVYEGKYNSDFNVVDSFYKRATGFEIDSEKIYCQEGQVIRVPIKEYYPPDSGAALNWLKNRHPEHWRDKKEIELINPKEKLAEILGCSVEELPGDNNEVLNETEPIKQDE